jgi:alpha galactosidase C-like protein
MPVPELRPVWDLKIRRSFTSWDVVSVFNFGDEQREYQVPFESLGLENEKQYLVYEFWSRKFLGVERGAIQARVEPRSNLLLAVHELEDHPQFVSTDRHISQGGVELTDLAWNAERSELTARLKLVENDPLSVVVYVPAPYAFSKATAEGAAVGHIAQSAPIVTVTLRRPASGEANLILAFARRAAGARSAP